MALGIVFADVRCALASMQRALAIHMAPTSEQLPARLLEFGLTPSEAEQIIGEARSYDPFTASAVGSHVAGVIRATHTLI